MAQRSADVLVTVVDDGCVDDTADVVADFHPAGVQYARFAHSRGVAAARNAGVLATSRPFLAFLDGDDVLPPDRTAQLLAALKPSDAGYAYGVSRTFEHPNAPGTPPTTLMPGPAPGTLLIRRDAFTRVGMLNETIAYLSLSDWLLRAQEAGITGISLNATSASGGAAVRRSRSTCGRRQLGDQGRQLAGVDSRLVQLLGGGPGVDGLPHVRSGVIEPEVHAGHTVQCHDFVVDAVPDDSRGVGFQAGHGAPSGQVRTVSRTTGRWLRHPAGRMPARRYPPPGRWLTVR